MIYPLVPWAGVMALGYAAGPAVFSQDAGAPRRLVWTGALTILGFVVLRTLNGYGDPSPRLDDGSPALLAMSFLNVTKYPPSLLFVLMTLGPAFVALAFLRRAKGPLADVMITFGRVPFLFYVTHLYLVHALAVAAGVAQGFPGFGHPHGPQPPAGGVRVRVARRLSSLARRGGGALPGVPAVRGAQGAEPGLVAVVSLRPGESGSACPGLARHSRASFGIRFKRRASRR